MTARSGRIGGRDPGGRFVAAAEAFFSLSGDELPLGAEGVRAITQALLSHAADDDGSGDERFVEGCGAALGLLLADAYGGWTATRAGRSIVLVGEHGSVDPFVLVREALEASDPRESLARGLELAEREARGTGPVASAVRAFVDALGELGASARVRERFALELVLDDGTEVDLERVARAGRAGPSVARRLAAVLTAHAGAAAAYAEERERLLPRVVGDAFLTRLGSSAAALAITPLAAGLHLGLIAHHGDRARFIRRAELDEAGERFEDAARLALDRLARTSPTMEVDADRRVACFASRDGLDASRILLPAVHRALEEALGAPPLLAAPHRDLLLASSDRARLEALAEDAYARAPHGVAPHVYVARRGRVTRA